MKISDGYFLKKILFKMDKTEEREETKGEKGEKEGEREKPKEKKVEIFQIFSSPPTFEELKIQEEKFESNDLL